MEVAATIAAGHGRAQGGRDQVDRAGRHRRPGARPHRPRCWAGRGSALGFDVVSNPEFLKEGAAVADCMRPERIIVGTSDPASEELLREVYEPFSRNHDKIIVMDVRSAELTKYAANCMLATKISFMNEMAGLAERLGADIEAVRQGIGSDSAHRLPVHLSRRRLRRLVLPQGREGADRTPPAPPASSRRVLQAVEDRNDAQKTVIFEKIRRHYARPPRGPQPSRSGASPSSRNTDDMREAASPGADGGALGGGRAGAGLRPARRWRRRSASTATGPTCMLCGTKEAALRDADALVVITEWQAFRAPDFELIREKLKAPVIFDGRNLYDPGPHGAQGLRLLRHRPRARRAAGGRRPRRPEAAPLRVLVTGAPASSASTSRARCIARGDAVTGFDNVNDYYDVAPEGGAPRRARPGRGGDRGAPTPSCAPISPTGPRSRPPSRARPSTG